jgi:CelD/BcsL family acetyltransferase involved in cellulose biosynthesis
MDSALQIEVRPPEAIGAAWQRLWSRVPGATPFAAPGWLVPWARHYAPGRCWVATVKVAGELVGCLPLFWWDGQVLLAGTGPSDHGDALFLPGSETWAAELLRRALDALDRPVERIVFEQLPPTSALLAVPCPPGWRDSVEPGQACPLLPLAGDDGMAHVPKRMRRNWRYAMHCLEREGARIERAPDEALGTAVADLVRLHGARWAVRGESGVLADPLLRRLLEDAAPALAEAGQLRLHRLRVDARTVAVLFALHGQRRTCCFLSGFDPAFARLSPVTALVGATLAAAAREGDVALDFLRGEEPYKYAWGAAPELPSRRVFVPLAPTPP